MTEAVIHVGGLIGYGGLSEAFGEDREAFKQRWKGPRRRIDWQALFKMMCDAGMTQADISAKTGIQEKDIKKVLNGEPALQKWDQAIAALGVFTMNLGDQIPLLGDYHPCVKIDD
jgi:hypothetical protein